MPDQYLAPLSDLLDASAIPGDFEAVENLVQDGIDALLGQVKYKDYFVETPSVDISQHYLIIVTKSLKLPLLGGMSLVFFKGSETDTSEFPITFELEWALKKYISNFNTLGFSYAPNAFIDILNDLTPTDEESLISEMITTFIDDGTDTYLDFMDNLKDIISDYSDGATAVDTELDNINDQIDIIKTEVEELLTSTSMFTPKDLFDNYKDNTVFTDAIDIISDSLETLRDSFDIEINIIVDLIKTALSDISDLATQFEKLLSLFQNWLTDITEDEIKALLIPQFAIELSNINMALEFPRNWLVPAIPDPTDASLFIEDPDTNELAAIEFVVGNLKYSTKHGFEMDNQSSFNFDRAFIGNTGILLEFSNLKVDLSESYNIPEADADGRPKDFQGVYAESASVILPSKWFKDTDGTNAEIFGENLLIGTGGFSGVVGLRALGGDNMFWANIGADNGFRVGFQHFDIQFKQNKVISSNIKGAMEIKKFVYPDGTIDENDDDISGQQVTIGIDGHIHDNGDFNLTASAEPPYPIELKDIFTYHIGSLELGLEDDDFYVGTSGELEFQGFLKDVLKLKSFSVDRLRIYTDGTIELEGGSIALAEPIVLPLGPVEITVTAIHFGSHQKEVNGQTRKFNYFGFDGGISVDPLGIEVRGDGVKFYFCTDNLPDKPLPYLHIQTIHLDLTIPASTPVAIINGWLSIPEPGDSKEYAGGIKIQLPQAKIAGSADMKLMPKYPAFIIDASIDLPAPIAMGPVALYGFRGLIGYRYVAEKEAVGLVSGVDSWYDYYKASPRGIHVTKFNGPDRTKASGTPFSIGAGASLGTSPDNGTVLNIKAMVLLSIPSLFMIDGRAAILSARLGLDDSGEPPFFAFIAIGDNSLELGFGADFKMPSKGGEILELYADIQAGFFFNDSSNWYVNIGTKTNPITARVLTLMSLSSYIMLSASGIEGGARGEFSFYRKYGPIKVSAWAYIEAGGKISFEKPQFGAYLAAGVGADIDIKVVSLYASFDILFGVEAPKPFLIYGEFRYSVEIKIAWVFKFKFSGDLAVSWEYSNEVDTSPIDPMINPENSDMLTEKVQGVNMLSNETFELAYLGANPPTGLSNAITDIIIPLDTYIDIKLEKGVIPNAIEDIIGNVNNPAINYTDNVPPEPSYRGKDVRQVTHDYSIESISLKSWNPQTNSWNDYHPYKALYPDDASLDNQKIGQFQQTDGQYSTIRLLADSPFDYTEQGQSGWYVPEQNGTTAATLFCEGEKILKKCADFLEKILGTRYYCLDQNQLFYSNKVAFFIYRKTDDEFGLITDEENHFDFEQSLQFNNHNVLQIRLPKPSIYVELKLTSYGSGVKIKYYAIIRDKTTPHVQYGNPNPNASDPTKPYQIFVGAKLLDKPVIYEHSDWLPISKIEILPQHANSDEIARLQEQIANINHNNNLIRLDILNGEIKKTDELEHRLNAIISQGCFHIPSPGVYSQDHEISEKDYEERLDNLLKNPDFFEPIPRQTPSECPDALICELFRFIKLFMPCFDRIKNDDYRDQIDCARKVLNIIIQFNRRYPYCNILKIYKNLPQVIVSFLQKPEPEYLNEMIKALDLFLEHLQKRSHCNDECNKDKYLCDLRDNLFEKRNLCLPHPLQSSNKELESYFSCFREINLIVSKIERKELQNIYHGKNPIVTFLNKPVLGNYEGAYNMLQEILNLLAKLGNCHCEVEHKNCHTLLHEVCWLSFESYKYNINIPSQAAITEDTLATIEGLTNQLKPIFRPYTSYYVNFVLKDQLGNQGSGSATYSFTYGFSTAGPVGFFHTHEKATYGDYIDSDGNTVEDANGIVRNGAGVIVPQIPELTPHPEKYALTSLRQYIDYQRSYPNADGNLLSAKPLFYDDETTKIDLFFIKEYTQFFFYNWESYNGQDSINGRIKIIIKDPREGDEVVNPPYLDYDPADSYYLYIPQTIESWEDDPNPIVPHVFDLYKNLIESNECIPVGGDSITPRSMYLVVFPKHLKPNKLYTALVNNLYDLDNDGDYNESEINEVHKFSFKTSRYASFKEQVNSYILSDDDPDTPTFKNAVFDILKGFTSDEIQAAYDTITQTPNVLADGLIIKYQHAFDRVVEGILGLPPLEAAISTEFNLVKDINNGDTIVAIIIRNPEPFNNPKIPIEEILDTVQVLSSFGTEDMSYKAVFSKDYSQLIIMKDSLNILAGLFTFKFQYKIWDGTNYSVPSIPKYSNDEVGTIYVEDIELI